MIVVSGKRLDWGVNPSGTVYLVCPFCGHAKLASGFSYHMKTYHAQDAFTLRSQARKETKYGSVRHGQQ